MATLVKPSRQVSFTDLAKNDPRAFPADRLDSQIQNLIDAIHSTQVALSEVRRDDGQLRMPPAQTRERADLAKLEDKLLSTTAAVATSAAAVSATAKDVHLRIKDAEIAAFTAVNSLAEVERQGAQAKDTFDDAENAADRAEYHATQAQNSANYSQAQSDNAIAAKTEATQWAEYLAGPVVSAADAPAYIQGHPFGHGLYYQPVEGYGGVAGLWSAKWWAVYAAQLVGSWSFYYLGAWTSAPVPGSTNPATGVAVPSPLAPGSFYYNTALNQLFIWDGDSWAPPFVQVLTPGFESSYTYIATAGQTAFSGPDAYGQTPVVGLHPSDVHVNGLKLVYGANYSVNVSTNTLILVTPAAANAVVQWDLLISKDELGAGGVTVRKLTITPIPDGANTVFTMTWTDPASGQVPTDITGASQLQLSLDGIIQEPNVDYVCTGDDLSMAIAPQANSRFWALWYAAGTDAPPPSNAPPLNQTLPVIAGQTLQGSLLTVTSGGWTGYPMPTYAYQWKSAGTNVGLNQSAYTTQVGDVGKIITATVTATNALASVPATSANFGPVIAIDTTPAGFTFVDVTNAALGAVVESNTLTITGINAPAPLSITGGEYSINGGAYASAATTIVSGNLVQVRGTASTSPSTPVNVTLTIGGISDIFTITTTAVGSDTTPDPFTFVDVNNALPATQVVSAPIIVAGINAPTPISVLGGEYSKNGGAFTSAASTVVVGDSIRARGVSSSFAGAQILVMVTIGSVTGDFNIRTATASDSTPDQFTFVDVSGAVGSTQIISNEITLTGINVSVNMTISGGEYSINGGAFTTVSPTTVFNGTNIRLRATSSSTPGGVVNVIMSIGVISDTFTVTTAIAPANTGLPVISDTTPQVGQTVSTTPGTWSGAPAPSFAYQWMRGLPDTPPFNTTAPNITGTPEVGATLTTTNGTWTGSPVPTYARQWRRAGLGIPGATGLTYTLVTADLGANITCVVTATNSVSSVNATSNTLGPVAAAPGDTDADAWAAAVVAAGGTVSAGRKTAVTTFIQALKSAGLWTTLDRYYLFAAESQIQATVSITAEHNVIEAVNGSTWSATTGFTGGSPKYLRTGFTPNVGTPKYSLNSATIGGKVQNTRTLDAAEMVWGGANGAFDNVTRFYPRTGATALYGVNQSGTDGPVSGVDSSLGMWTTTRTASNATALYRNGVSVHTGTGTAAGTPSDGMILVFACSQGGNYAVAYGNPNDQLTSLYIGSGWNATQALNFYNAERALMTAIGIT